MICLLRMAVVRVGKPASEGVRVVAETGDCSVLSVRFGMRQGFQQCSVVLKCL